MPFGAQHPKSVMGPNWGHRCVSGWRPLPVLSLPRLPPASAPAPGIATRPVGPRASCQASCRRRTGSRHGGARWWRGQGLPSTRVVCKPLSKGNRNACTSEVLKGNTVSDNSEWSLPATFRFHTGSHFPTCAEAEGLGESSFGEQVDCDGRAGGEFSARRRPECACGRASPRALLGAGVLGRSSLPRRPPPTQEQRGQPRPPPSAHLRGSAPFGNAEQRRADPARRAFPPNAALRRERAR